MSNSRVRTNKDNQADESNTTQGMRETNLHCKIGKNIMGTNT